MDLSRIKFLYGTSKAHFQHEFWPADPHWWDSPGLIELIRDWCAQNSGFEGIAWEHDAAIVSFAKDEDAFAFRLRWC